MRGHAQFELDESLCELLVRRQSFACGVLSLHDCRSLGSLGCNESPRFPLEGEWRRSAPSKTGRVLDSIPLVPAALSPLSTFSAATDPPDPYTTGSA